MKRLAALLASSFIAGDAVAQSYPSKPITLVVPLAIGSTSDILSRTIGAELANRQVTRVMAWPYITPHRSAHRDPRGAAKALGVSRLLLVSVRQGSQPPRVTLYFVDAISGQKIWVKDYSREGLSEPTVRQELAQRVAAEFPVQPQGGR